MRTSEDIAIELFSLLDNIDTLSDICKDNDKLFRKLAMREVSKRFDFADTDGYKVRLKTIEDEQPDAKYVYSYMSNDGRLVIVREVPTEQ